MKITCDRKRLADAINIVAGVATGNTAHPITECVLLTAIDAGVVTMRTTNFETEITTSVECVNVSGVGSVLVPAKRVQQILATSGGEEITLQREGSKARIDVAGGRFTLLTNDENKFPSTIPLAGQITKLTVSAASLLTAIGRTIFCTDPLSSKFAISGVCLDVTDSPIMVATDGRRMAAQELAVAGPFNNSNGIQRVIIPKASLAMVRRTLARSDDSECHIAVAGNVASFTVGEITVKSRLCEGLFPKWREIVKRAECRSGISVLASKFSHANEQASVFAAGNSRGADYTLNEKRDCVSIVCDSPEAGEAHIEFGIDEADSDAEVNVRLDPEFVNSFFRAVSGSERIRLTCGSSGTPARFTTQDGYVYVVMPMVKE